MVNCYVLGCRSRSEQKNNNITFHRFPKEGVLLDIWKKFTGRTDWEPTQFSRICSKHFEPASFRKNKGTTRLNANSVPTLIPTEQAKKKIKKSYTINENEIKEGDTVPFQTKYEPIETRSNSTKLKNLGLQEEKMSETEQNIIAVKEENISECRSCLQNIYSDSTYYNIFESWDEFEGVDITIAEGLSRIANIHLTDTDMYPKVICEECCALLQSAQHFAANIRRTDQILRQRYERVPIEHDIDDKVWPKPIQLDINVNNSIYNTDVEIKKEILSDDEFNSNANEISQEYDCVNMDIKIEPEELTCQSHLETSQIVVNGTFSMDNSKVKSSHLTNGLSNRLEELPGVSVKEEPVSDAESESTATDLPLECMLCMKTLNSITGLKAHVIALHSYKSVKRKLSNSITPEKKKPKYTCSICRRSFITSTDLMVHETCHNKSVCYSCHQSFNTFSELTAHRRRCKPITTKEVTKLKTLNDVKRPHSSESQLTVTCIMCNESFSGSYDLREHNKVHHPENIEHQNSDDTLESWPSGTMSESDV